jgi:3-mercaptopyruvate sulfurtransferase SseA
MGGGAIAARPGRLMRGAGFPAAALYVGSWRGWITGPTHPVAQDNRCVGR